MNSVNFRALFQALSSPYMILDRDCVYLDVNPAYEAVVERPREELVGRNIFAVFPGQGDNAARLRASIDRVFETGRPDTLAYIPYSIDLPGAEGDAELRVWSAVHSPLLDDDGHVYAVLQNTVDVTELVRERAAPADEAAQSILASEIALIQRAQEMEAAVESTRRESSNFRRLFQQAPGMIAVLSGPDHLVTFANDAYLRFIGDRAVLGLPIRRALPEIEGQEVFEKLDAVFAEGRSFSGEGMAVTLRRRSDGPSELAFMDFSFEPVRDADGTVSGVFVQGTDRTEAVKAGRRQRRLMDELNHRVKNTLAAVQSIARQSFRNIRDPEAARYAFEARILALSKAHNLLSEREWEAASLRRLVGQELAEVEPARFELRGRDAELCPKATVALAMVFHELAMNAARYGALGRPGGRLAVSWEPPEDDAPLRIVWRETWQGSVPAETEPGYGMRLMRRIVEGELDGSFELDFAADGLICRLEVVNAEGGDAAGPAF